MKTACLIIGILFYVGGVVTYFTDKQLGWYALVLGIFAGTILLALWKIIALLEKKNEVQ